MTATSPNSPEQIDASGRMPLLTLFGGAALWLALSSGFGLMASMTFHKPSMFADCSVLTYGRAVAAWSHLLIYGFCIPAGLGVGLWILARLGRVPLAQPFLITIGAKFWHLGVLVGWVAIMAGVNTGYEWFEMPRYASVILFLAFVLMAIWAFVTYTRRTVSEHFPSHWFLLAALFWFPWILSTAILLLQFYPVRGVVQAAVAWWFAGNLLNVWLSLAGLGASFYFIPKISGKPLQSHYFALFVFLTLVLFGTWTGIPTHAALPAWMPTLSACARLLAFVPALGAAVIAMSTGLDQRPPYNGGPLCFSRFGTCTLGLAALVLALTACPQINRVTDFTWFNHGENLLRIYGFFAMTMFGAIYYILPRLTAEEYVCSARVRAHFWLSLIGTLLFALPLLVGGLKQGLALANGKLEFLDTTKAAVMFFRMSSLGEFLLLVGSLLFLFNVAFAIGRYTCALYQGLRQECVAPTGGLPAAGVKS